jgi:hypothetical protein
MYVGGFILGGSQTNREPSFVASLNHNAKGVRNTPVPCAWNDSMPQPTTPKISGLDLTGLKLRSHIANIFFKAILI